VAIKTNGTIWACGGNYQGQQGNGVADASNPNVFTQIGALTNWLKVSAGAYFTLAVKTDGTMWSWGQNDLGTLGINTDTSRSSPVQVGALTTWSQISTGYNTASAIKTNGTLWSWGDNGSGALGDGTTITRSSPVQIGALTTWTNVAAGSGNMYATVFD